MADLKPKDLIGVPWRVALALQADVEAVDDLAVALAAGVAPSRIGLHGNNKSVAEIERAVDLDLGSIVPAVVPKRQTGAYLSTQISY